QAPGSVDGAGSRRLISSDARELEDLLATRLTGRPRFHPNAAPLPEEPHIVVVLDGLSLPPDSVLATQEGLQGVTVVEVVPGDAASVDTKRTWRPRSLAERLRVPIGLGEDGRPVMLDLKEAAQEGMGPHGLCVGATGSGKSELLRTLVLGLAVTHSSETLNFVLADFKGGATFAGMSQMPHVAAVITNMAEELTLV